MGEGTPPIMGGTPLPLPNNGGEPPSPPSIGGSPPPLPPLSGMNEWREMCLNYQITIKGNKYIQVFGFMQALTCLE